MPRCKRSLAMPTAKSSAHSASHLLRFLYELGDLGFSMVGLEHMERVKRDVEPEVQPEPAAAE